MDSSPPQALAPHTGSSSGNVVSKRATSRDQDGGKVEQRSSFLNFGRIHSEESQGIFPRLVSFDPTASRQSQGTTGHTTASHEVHPEKKGAVFVDAESMKAKVRQNLQKRQHNVKEYYKDSGVWQSIARSQKFEVITLGVIALNSLWIAVDTDLNDAEILLNAHPVFQVAEHFFCAFFFFEWLTRYMAFKRKRDCLKDAWFLFDSGLVFMMVSETWIMTGITLLTGAGAGGGAGNTSVLRIARLLRLTRMARMARLLRAMPELMILIKGMLAASRSVVFTLLLLLILMYVFAIAMTQLLAEAKHSKDEFRTVLQSMYTLWLHGTLLDDINWLQHKISKDSKLCTVIFFLFVLLASLTVMNMLIGVLCEVVSAVAATEKEEMLVNYVNDKLRDVVMLLDRDGDMKISKSEFMRLLENAEACRCLEDVGVDVLGLIDSVDAIFTDKNDLSNGKNDLQLDFPKFMEVVLQLRGTNNATVKDVVELRKFVRDAMWTTHNEMREMREEMRQMLSVVNHIAASSPFGMPVRGPSASLGEHLKPAKGFESVSETLLWPRTAGLQLDEKVLEVAAAAQLASPIINGLSKPLPPQQDPPVLYGRENGCNGHSESLSVAREHSKDSKGRRRDTRSSKIHPGGETAVDAQPSQSASDYREKVLRHYSHGYLGSNATPPSKPSLLECMEVPLESTPPQNLDNAFSLSMSDDDLSLLEDNSEVDYFNDVTDSRVGVDGDADNFKEITPTGFWSCQPMPGPGGRCSGRRKFFEQPHPKEVARPSLRDRSRDSPGMSSTAKPSPPNGGSNGAAAPAADLQLLALQVGKSLSLLLADLQIMHEAMHIGTPAVPSYHQQRYPHAMVASGHRNGRRQQPADECSNGSAPDSMKHLVPDRDSHVASGEDV